MSALPWAEKMFLGTAVHRLTAAALRTNYGERFEYRTLGPDFLDTKTGLSVELTTPGGVRSHAARPGYEGVEIVTYILGQ